MLPIKRAERERPGVRLPAPPLQATPGSDSSPADFPLFLRHFCSGLVRGGRGLVGLVRPCRDQSATRRGEFATAFVGVTATAILPDLACWFPAGWRPLAIALLLALAGCGEERCRDTYRLTNALASLTCTPGASLTLETHDGRSWAVCRCAGDAGAEVAP